MHRAKSRSQEISSPGGGGVLGIVKINKECRKFYKQIQRNVIHRMCLKCLENFKSEFFKSKEKEIIQTHARK